MPCAPLVPVGCKAPVRARADSSFWCRRTTGAGRRPDRAWRRDPGCCRCGKSARGAAATTTDRLRGGWMRSGRTALVGFAHRFGEIGRTEDHRRQQSRGIDRRADEGSQHSSPTSGESQRRRAPMTYAPASTSCSFAQTSEARKASAREAATNEGNGRGVRPSTRDAVEGAISGQPRSGGRACQWPAYDSSISAGTGLREAQ